MENTEAQRPAEAPNLSGTLPLTPPRPPPFCASSSRESFRVLCETWNKMVGCFPRGEVSESVGVNANIGHVPMPFFNMVAQNAPLADKGAVRGFVHSARQKLAGCEYPAILVVCPAWLPDGWNEVAAEMGLVPAMSLTGMESAGLLPSRRPAPPELEIRRITDVSAARDLAMVKVHAYGMPAELAECLAKMDLWAMWRAARCVQRHRCRRRALSTSH